MNCRSKELAGGAKKCAFVKRERGFDEAVDHHLADFESHLSTACPSGVDVYFENVGGEILQAVLPMLNQFARVPDWGLIAQSDGAGHPRAIDLAGAMRVVLSKRPTLRGFINYDVPHDLYEDFQREISPGIAEGRIRYGEDIGDGLKKCSESTDRYAGWEKFRKDACALRGLTRCVGLRRDL